MYSARVETDKLTLLERAGVMKTLPARGTYPTVRSAVTAAEVAMTHAARTR